MKIQFWIDRTKYLLGISFMFITLLAMKEVLWNLRIIIVSWNVKYFILEKIRS
jgi:hypothetical protein